MLIIQRSGRNQNFLNLINLLLTAAVDMKNPRLLGACAKQLLRPLTILLGSVENITGDSLSSI